MFGLPFAGTPVRPEWALTLAMLDRPLAYNYAFTPVHGKNVDDARNCIAALAIEHKCKYLFFLDDDVTPPKYALARLTAYLEKPHHKDVMVAGGIYCSKTDPPLPMVFRNLGAGPTWDWKKGDIFEVDGLATGCMLIRTEVFDKLERPYFKEVFEPSTDEDPGVNCWSDDLYFCDKVRKAGYKIVADGSLLCTHWDLNGKMYDLPADSYPMLPREDTKTDTSDSKETSVAAPTSTPGLAG